MQTKQRADTKDINARILQLERRLTMKWYNKDQLLKDMYRLRETIHMISRQHEEVNNHIDDYYKKLDRLIDQLI